MVHAMHKKIIYFADLKVPGSLKFLLCRAHSFIYIGLSLKNSFGRNAKHSIFMFGHFLK